MQVVALKSFFSGTGNTHQGGVLDVTDKVGKAWVDAGLVRLFTDDDKNQPAPTTASFGAPTAPSEPADTDTDDEVVAPETDEPTGDQPDVDADKERVTGTDGEKVELNTPLAPVQNNKPNAKKESK